MAKGTITERVNKYSEKHPKVYDLPLARLYELTDLGDIYEVAITAFAYGYMKASKAKKGGAR